MKEMEGYIKSLPQRQAEKGFEGLEADLKADRITKRLNLEVKNMVVIDGMMVCGYCGTKEPVESRSGSTWTLYSQTGKLACDKEECQLFAQGEAAQALKDRIS